MPMYMEKYIRLCMCVVNIYTKQFFRLYKNELKPIILHLFFLNKGSILNKFYFKKQKLL